MSWKEEAIADYQALKGSITKLEQSIRDDPRIRELVEEEDKILKKINEITETRNHAIEEAKRKQDVVTVDLKKRWDIEDKTFECDAGSAMIRTTKSLIVTDKMALVDRLAEILNNKQKAFDCIRSFDLITIRKYMDVDLIAEYIAHYDEKQSVIIKGVKDK